MSIDYNGLLPKNDEYMDSVNERMYELFKKKAKERNDKPTEERFAEIVDSNQGSISKVKKIPKDAIHTSRLNIEQYIVMAKYLEISLDEMFGLTEPEEKNVIPAADEFSPRELCTQLAALIMSGDQIDTVKAHHDEYRPDKNGNNISHSDYEYDAIYFPEYTSSGSCDISVNYYEANHCINQFLSCLRRLLKSLDNGDLDKDDFDTVLEKHIKSIPESHSEPVNWEIKCAVPYGR